MAVAVIYDDDELICDVNDVVFGSCDDAHYYYFCLFSFVCGHIDNNIDDVDDPPLKWPQVN